MGDYLIKVIHTKARMRLNPSQVFALTKGELVTPNELLIRQNLEASLLLTFLDSPPPQPFLSISPAEIKEDGKLVN